MDDPMSRNAVDDPRRTLPASLITSLASAPIPSSAISIVAAEWLLHSQMEHMQMSETISAYARDVDAVRQRMVEHPVFAAIRDIPALRTFMEAHVFARFGISCRLSSDCSATSHASRSRGSRRETVRPRS